MWSSGNPGVTINDGEAHHDFLVTLYFQSTFARFPAQNLSKLRNCVDNSSKLGLNWAKNDGIGVNFSLMRRTQYIGYIGGVRQLDIILGRTVLQSNNIYPITNIIAIL